MSKEIENRVSATPLAAPETSRADWPCYVYLGLFVLNTLLLLLLESVLLRLPLVLLQGLFFVGMLELTHQSVHRRFILQTTVNEWVGTLAAGLIGFNLVAYRHFHLQHHRHTCDAIDPEGRLYYDSPRTRWFWLGAPVAHLWVAFAINRMAPDYVPTAKKSGWQRGRIFLLLIVSGLIVWALVAPLTFALAYAMPLCLFAWTDFLFSQAEHYAAPIHPGTARTGNASDCVGNVSFDIQVPLWLSHLMLNRNLHRVHHVWPGTRWFEAPARLSELAPLQPGRVLSFAEFGSRWFADGPRLWPHNAGKDRVNESIVIR